MVVLGLFFLGLCVGSFLNVVIERLPEGRSVVGGRSHCLACEHVLTWRDLIPLLSFALLKGRCRYCQKPISVQYPVVEFVTGILFALSSLPVLIATIFLLPVFVIDLKHGIIPDKLVFPGIFLVIGYWLLVISSRILGLYQNLENDVGGLGPYLLQTDFFKNHAWLELRPLLLTLLGSVFLFFCFFVLHRLFRGRAMGGGDVKLAFLVGLIAGWPNMIVAVFASFLTGAIVSVILMLLRKKSFGETVPFGPFMVVGTYIALLFGRSVLEWYLGFL